MPVLGRGTPNRPIVLRGSEDTTDFNSRTRIVVVTQQPQLQVYNRTVILRNTLQDPAPPATPTPGPIVVTAQRSSYFQPTATTVLRNTLQDPPVLTTPTPVVINQPYPPQW